MDELKETPPLPREPMLRFFRYEHLPAELQAMSRPFGDLARDLCERLPASAERTKALNDLLRSKDWAVRALLPTGGDR